MKKNSLPILMLIAFAMLVSCKKDSVPATATNNDVPIPPKTAVDTLKMIQGLWKGTSYYTMELKSDFSFIQDWTNADMGYYKAKYLIRNDSLLVTDGSNNVVWLGGSKILKLTQDSLILKANGFILKHVRYSVPVSSYGITAFAALVTKPALYQLPFTQWSANDYLNDVIIAGDGTIYMLWQGEVEKIVPGDKKVYSIITPESVKPFEQATLITSLFIHPVNGDIYFATVTNIYKYSLKTKQVSKVFFQTPGTGNTVLITGIAVDKDDNIYIADSYKYYVYRIDTKTQLPVVIAGKGIVGGFDFEPGAGTNTYLNPSQITLDNANNLFIADQRNGAIWKLDVKTNKIKLVAGDGFGRFSGDGGPAINASINWADGVAVDGKGCVYISDKLNTRVRKVDEKGNIGTIAGRTYGLAGNNDDANQSTIDPAHLCVNQSGTELLVVDEKRGTVQKLYLR